MSIKQCDKNRAELVKAIIRQNGGRIFTVVAKRKAPKVSYRGTQVVYEGDGVEHVETVSLKPREYKRLLDEEKAQYVEVVENFMELTCRTGVKSQLRGGASTIAHKDDLISVNLTNGKGYRCFSAFNVLSIKAMGTEIKFKEEHVLGFEGE